MGLITRLSLAALAALIATLIIRSLPDAARYLKIREM